MAVLNKMSLVLEDDTTRLSDDKIRQITFQFSEWLYANVEPPSLDMVNWKKLLTLMMMLS